MTSPSRTSQTRVLASGPNTTRQYFGVRVSYFGSFSSVRSILVGSTALAGVRATATSSAAAERWEGRMGQCPLGGDGIPGNATTSTVPRRRPRVKTSCL